MLQFIIISDVPLSVETKKETVKAGKDLRDLHFFPWGREGRLLAEDIIVSIWQNLGMIPGRLLLPLSHTLAGAASLWPANPHGAT